MITLAVDPIASMLLRIVILFALMGVVCFIMNKNYKKNMERRSERLQKEYAVLTPSKLSEVSDEELVDVVIANLNAKQDKQNPDPFYTIPLLSPGRFSVYSIWLIHNELNHGNFVDLMHSPSAKFCEPAADGLDQLGATQCALALRQAMDAENEDTLADCHIAYIDAESQENPLELCVSFIKDNLSEFIDEEESETT